MSVKKVSIVPFQTQKGLGFNDEPSSKVTTIKDRSNLKMMNLLQVMAKLAIIQGYNENGFILGSNGEYLDNTNIATLLIHSMAPGKLISGESEFIKLLRKAQVQPFLILNEVVRSKLISDPGNMYTSKKVEEPPEIIINEVRNDPVPVELVAEQVPKTFKRKLNEAPEQSNQEEFIEERKYKTAKRVKKDIPDGWFIPKE